MAVELPAIFLGIAGIAWVLSLWGLAAHRHLSFRSHLNDLGIFEHVIWNTAHGYWFDSSIYTSNYLGVHFSPALLLFVPGYLLWPDTRALLLLQAAVIGLSAVPLYLLGRHWLGASWLAAAIGLLALVNPHNVLLALTDFYPDALALPLLGSALWALETRRYRLLLIASGGLVLVREDFACAVVGLGMFVLLTRRNDPRWLGPALGAFGLLYLLAMVGVVIPLIAGRPYLYGDLNPDLGSGPLGLTVGILRDPLAVLRHLVSPPRPDYLFWLFGPLLGLPWFRPLYLVPGLPLLLRNLLSNNGNLVSINRHYHAAIIPALLSATAGALAILPRPWARLAAVALVTAALLFDGYVVAGLVITSELPVEPGPEAAAYREVLRRIPPDGAVAASNRLGAHLAARRHLWSFASGGAQAEPAQADWVAVDLDDHDGLRTESADALLARLQTTDPPDQFREVFREGSVILLCRRTETRCTD